MYERGHLQYDYENGINIYYTVIYRRGHALDKTL